VPSRKRHRTLSIDAFDVGIFPDYLFGIVLYRVCLLRGSRKNVVESRGPLLDGRGTNDEAVDDFDGDGGRRENECGTAPKGRVRCGFEDAKLGLKERTRVD
jgi:hypothetical protein